MKQRLWAALAYAVLLATAQVKASKICPLNSAIGLIGAVRGSLKLVMGRLSSWTDKCARVADLGTGVDCPYDFTSLQALTPLCYDTTSGSALSMQLCCKEIYSAALFSIAQHTNLTGVIFSNRSQAQSCILQFVDKLHSVRQLDRAIFSTACPLPASRITRSASPCNFGSMSELQRQYDIANVSKACGEGLEPGQKGCQTCQGELLQASLKLAGLTGDQPGACGTSIAIALTSLDPDLVHFEGFFTCVLQILENVPVSQYLTIGEAPGFAPESVEPVHSVKSSAVTFRALIIFAGIFGGLGSLVIATLIIFYFARRHNPSYVFAKAFLGIDSQKSVDAREMSLLPTEGFYVFTIKELMRATNSFSSSLLIGEGSAGMVYKGQLPSGKLVAVKRIQHEKNVDTFYQEVELLARVRHPNLTALLGYCQFKRMHLLVYEYMSNGDLAQKLLGSGEAGPVLTWDERVSIALDCARGLTYLHEGPEGPIIHRDIKPTNILLNEFLEAKLSDFGLSKILGVEASHVSTEVKGTTGYLDPEYLLLGQLTESSDVYSFGIVLLQLISGRKAIDTDTKCSRSIVQIALPMSAEGGDLLGLVDAKLEGWYSVSAFKQIAAVAIKCIQPRSYDRPSVSEVLHELELAWKLSKSRSLCTT